MKIVSKTIALALTTALISTSVLPVTSAQAHDKRKWHKHKGHHKVVRHHKHRKRYYKSNKGDKVVAGVIGFAIGAILASEAAKNQRVVTQPRTVYQPTYRAPQPIYRNVEPTYYERDYGTPRYNDNVVERRPIDDLDQPRVITYDEAVAQTSYEPWSTGWANYCRSKYRSFNINTGTFRGYDGKDHFCVVK